MSTRSRIGIEEETGTIRSVYCHFDGYPSGVGATLLKAYMDPQKVRDLISQGGISSLGEEIGGKHVFPADRILSTPSTGLESLQALKAARWTTFYHRDRDEDLLIQTNSSRKEFKIGAFDSWEEYAYLFVTAKSEWIYIPRGKKNFVSLSEKACRGG